MTTGALVRVVLNGRPVEVPAGTRLADWLAAQGIDPRRVAVERNREIVPRATTGEIPMLDGDVFEVVHFVGGG